MNVHTPLYIYMYINIYEYIYIYIYIFQCVLRFVQCTIRQIYSLLVFTEQIVVGVVFIGYITQYCCWCYTCIGRLWYVFFLHLRQK